MQRRQSPLSLAELRMVLGPFCEKHRIRRLEVFGSVFSRIIDLHPLR
jgi:hypothetical protein